MSQASAAIEAKATKGHRLASRFIACFFLLYALCCGNVTLWRMIPVIGGRVEWHFAKPFALAAQYLAQHLFHIHGAGAVIHGSGYNDRALDWIAAGLMLALALIVAPLWTLLDRNPAHDATLSRWLRFILRLTLCAAMFVYGFSKLFDIQIGSPSLAVLHEPLGNTSPMTLLWTLLGTSPAYERVCGLTELAAGVLLLYRRTTLAGALLSIVILANIILFDCFFDVPVKLYATMLLLMTFILLGPHLRNMLAFFTHRHYTTPGIYDTPLYDHATLLINVLFLLTFGFNVALGNFHQHALEEANLSHPSPLTGQWHIEAPSQPFLTGDGQPAVDIFLEATGRVSVRAADDTLWPGGRYDSTTNTLRLFTPLRQAIFFNVTQQDPDHLTLHPTTPTYVELQLTRVPIPLHYRLFDRGFHLVNEWGFEQ